MVDWYHQAAKKLLFTQHFRKHYMKLKPTKFLKVLVTTFNKISIGIAALEINV